MCCNLVHIDQNASFKWNKANVILNYFYWQIQSSFA